MFKLFFTIVVSCLIVLSCSSNKSIQDINQQSFYLKNVKSEKIENAIIKAGSHRRWVCVVKEKGVIQCEQNARSHSATVDVLYTNDSFSIKHVKTTGLNEKNGKVHKKYNNWVEKLKESIINELNLLRLESK